MNFLKPAILCALIALLGYTGYTFFVQKNKVSLEVANLSETAKKLSDENTTLQRDIEYFKQKENLLKASKARFNFVADGEKLMIVVPDTESTVTSSVKQ